jgi:hypothetical protein
MQQAYNPQAVQQRRSVMQQAAGAAGLAGAGAAGAGGVLAISPLFRRFRGRLFSDASRLKELARGDYLLKARKLVSNESLMGRMPLTRGNFLNPFAPMPPVPIRKGGTQKSAAAWLRNVRGRLFSDASRLKELASISISDIGRLRGPGAAAIGLGGIAVGGGAYALGSHVGQKRGERKEKIRQVAAALTGNPVFRYHYNVAKANSEGRLYVPSGRR